MPHTTSSEVVTPLGAIAANDVWDDPRSLTTFRTFHQSNGNNNGAEIETSFHSQPRTSETKNCCHDGGMNGSIDVAKTNGMSLKNGRRENGDALLRDDARFPEATIKNNGGFGYLKTKSSPKMCNAVKPVTPPPDFNLKINNKLSVCEEIKNSSDASKGKQTLTSFGSILLNGSKPPLDFQRDNNEASTSVESSESKECESDQIKEEGGSDIVDIVLGPNDKRFGFSVVGGCNEGIAPRIENITPGSPADRADLEVGDEILEVNGRSLDNCTHTEVISHIHQCIRSRTICLRVKRKTSCKLALDLSRNSNVQDAFVIAVEQQARERLEKLSALKKIKPVDMTKLSQELNECANSTPELNGVIENNPIYVTTVPEIHNATLERVKKDRLDNYVNAPSSDKIGRDQIMRGMNGHGQIGIADHDQELELKQEILDREGYDETMSPSSPETPPRERLLVESHNGRDCVTTNFSQECVSVETLLPNLLDKLRSSPNENLHKQQLGSKQSDQNFQDRCKISTVAARNHGNRGESELKQHREMAVDVPDSFVGVAKTAPRYPPQKIPDANDQRKESHPEFFLYSSGDSSSAENDPSLKVNSVPYKNALNSKGNLIDRDSLPRVTVDSSEGLENASEEQLERIRKYQEDIRRRKLAEEKQAKEDEFLRTSLRGSKKLQSLEANPPHPPKHGVINTAFELEDDDSVHSRRGSSRLVGKVEDTKASTPELVKTFGASELLQSLYRLSSSLQGNGHKDSDLMLVESLIRNADFQNILAIHNKVQEVCCFRCPPTPVTAEAQEITQEAINMLQESSFPEAVELVDILSKYEMEGLMLAHDKIAERQTVPTITPDEELLDRASQYTEESVKIVRIDKTNEPLGATVRNEGEAVVIGRIVKGGAAEKSGLLHEGDEILEVNGVEMRGKSVNDVCDILATMNGTLTFLIIPTQQDSKKSSQREVVMHVKAHFDYDPDDDLYIPCRELGISFQKGDILHIISQDDPNWWQAYREGEEDQALAGLVPSKNFQQQRESMKQTIIGETNSKEKANKKAKFLCAKKYHKKKKKKLYNANLSDDLEGDQILTYEETALYYPRANRKRPTVLIGPPNIGRHELRQRLMEDTERFAAAVPHTSRTKRDAEVDGADYHFISRSQFEADIAAGKFVEHGEYEKNYYGTSLDAIRAVVNSGKICVLNLHPQSLKILKNSDLKPYVVFVAPPSLEKLRQNRMKAGDNPKDEELKDIIEKAREMEDNYGHYFDMVIINSDIDKAFNELLKEINTLEREPQWVPAIWLKNDAN